MEGREIIFDKNFEMYITPKMLNYEIGVILSDFLIAIEEDLSDEYKTKIASFINNITNWFGKSVDAVLEWGRRNYKIDFHESNVRLMNIYILYEQADEELYGLGFRVEFDTEHGCGLKIRGSDFEIVEIGLGEVAFC